MTGKTDCPRSIGKRGGTNKGNLKELIVQNADEREGRSPGVEVLIRAAEEVETKRIFVWGGCNSKKRKKAISWCWVF